MAFTFLQLEAFYWVALLGSFRAAAHQLNLTQPAVSLRVRELERELDTRLFYRSGKRPVVSALALVVSTGQLLTKSV
ncbi:MAG: LysR family transcriptional regulator [Rhodospirillales bacterium]|jgi:DNA-binding transcriptional LysR family regulator|nr:LysR family transcriptional regulator [Rhodospirillales bacterium]